MNVLTQTIKDLEIKHGGLRAAARYLGVSASYLGRLRDGKYDKPDKKILDKLRLTRKVIYAHTRNTEDNCPHHPNCECLDYCEYQDPWSKPVLTNS